MSLPACGVIRHLHSACPGLLSRDRPGTCSAAGISRTPSVFCRATSARACGKWQDCCQMPPHAVRQHRPRPAQSVRASTSPEGSPEKKETTKKPAIKRRSAAGTVALVLVVLASGTLNRIFYKMALNPLGNYVFFLAQFQTFSYVFVYFALLLIRRRAGQVTPEMLAAPAKWRFGVIGVCEALSQVMGFLAAAHLPGVVLPLLSQSIMFWQIALNKIVRNVTLKGVELVGALIVVAGVVCAAWPSSSGTSVFAQAHPMYTLLFLVSVSFPAVSTIFKETIFDEAKKKLKGQELDVFVVNSFGSAAQAVCVFLLLPVLSGLRGIPISQLPNYLREGWTCMRGLTPACCSDCSGAPQLATLYVLTNLAFNVSILTLLRSAGNIALTLTMASVLPLTIWAFTLDLPYLTPAPPLGANFIGGVVILSLGLLTYNSPKWLPALQKRGSPLLSAPE